MNECLRWLEKGLFALGVLLIGIFFGALLHGLTASRIALWRFDNAQISRATNAPVRPQSGVDVTLWSESRIQAYRESLSGRFDPPKGVLRIPRLRFVAPVFEGTDDLTLNRGLGWIVGTEQLGGSGNAGIAGHRDGFFRVLKDIEVGDSVDLLLEGERIQYIVQNTEIVDPDNTDVLKATNQSELTLVTCYPFYFIGSAPKRFIVQAVAVVKGSDTGRHGNTVRTIASH